MNIDTKALIAATPATVALVRRELDKSRESQRGGMQCGIPKAVNVDCAMVERLCRIAEKQADRLAALEESNTLLSASLKKQDAQIGRLEQDNARLKQQADALAWLEHETCDLRCINVPTGGDDYEVHWQVIEHHMAEPQERVIGYGETPARAIRDAQRTLAAGGDA